MAQERRGLIVLSSVMSVAGVRAAAGYRGLSTPTAGCGDPCPARASMDRSRGLSQRRCRFGIGYVDELPDSPSAHRLAARTFCVVMSARHKLAGRRSSVRPIRRQPVVACDRFAHDGGPSMPRQQIGGCVLAPDGGGLRRSPPAWPGRGPMSHRDRAAGLDSRSCRPAACAPCRWSPPGASHRVSSTLREREPTPAASGFLALLRREWPRKDDANFATTRLSS